MAILEKNNELVSQCAIEQKHNLNATGGLDKLCMRFERHTLTPTSSMWEEAC